MAFIKGAFKGSGTTKVIIDALRVHAGGKERDHLIIFKRNKHEEDVAHGDASGAMGQIN